MPRTNEKLIKFTPFATGDSRVIALARGRCCKVLPPEGAPWRIIGSVGCGAEFGPRVEASWPEILAMVERDGFFIGSIKEAPAINDEEAQQAQ
jgi:hypothetical protein